MQASEPGAVGNGTGNENPELSHFHKQQRQSEGQPTFCAEVDVLSEHGLRRLVRNMQVGGCSAVPVSQSSQIRSPAPTPAVVASFLLFCFSALQAAHVKSKNYALVVKTLRCSIRQ